MFFLLLLLLLLQLRITLLSDLPVHVDGEPWVQAAGQVVVLRSALKVNVKGRNTTYRSSCSS